MSHTEVGSYRYPRVPHPGVCRKLFDTWQDFLHQDPEFWFIRSIRDGLFWRNAAAGQLLPHMRPIEPVDHMLRWIHHADVPLVENAHSLALKTGQTQFYTYRGKIDPNRLVTIRSSAAADHCSACHKRCAVIIANPRPF